MIKKALTHWKTTSAGLVMIVGSTVKLVFAVRGGTASEEVWSVALVAIIGGIGLIFAGDSSATPPAPPTPPTPTTPSTP